MVESALTRSYKAKGLVPDLRYIYCTWNLFDFGVRTMTRRHGLCISGSLQAFRECSGGEGNETLINEFLALSSLFLSSDSN